MPSKTAINYIERYKLFTCMCILRLGQSIPVAQTRCCIIIIVLVPRGRFIKHLMSRDYHTMVLSESVLGREVVCKVISSLLESYKRLLHGVVLRNGYEIITNLRLGSEGRVSNSFHTNPVFSRENVNVVCLS